MLVYPSSLVPFILIHRPVLSASANKKIMPLKMARYKDWTDSETWRTIAPQKMTKSDSLEAKQYCNA